MATDYQPTKPGTLASRAEIAEILGTSRQRVHQIIADPEAKFPAPIDVLGGGLAVWQIVDVEAWKARHRPPAPSPATET